jgi:hypothetical protein
LPLVEWPLCAENGHPRQRDRNGGVDAWRSFVAGGHVRYIDFAAVWAHCHAKGPDPRAVVAVTVFVAVAITDTLVLGPEPFVM